LAASAQAFLVLLVLGVAIGGFVPVGVQLCKDLWPQLQRVVIVVDSLLHEGVVSMVLCISGHLLEKLLVVFKWLDISWLILSASSICRSGPASHCC